MFKVGDKVTSNNYFGTGTVVDNFTNKDNEYPIQVKFDHDEYDEPSSCNETFTNKGDYHIGEPNYSIKLCEDIIHLCTQL